MDLGICLDPEKRRQQLLCAAFEGLIQSTLGELVGETVLLFSQAFKFNSTHREKEMTQDGVI